VNRIRNRLIAAFLMATLVPFAATIWITTSLLDRSLGYATTGELDRLSRTLEATVRQLYQREREALRQDALSGRAAPTTYVVAQADGWPGPVRAFWDSGEAERFGLSGDRGDHVDYLRRRPDGDQAQNGVDTYRRDLRGIRMEQLSTELRDARRVIESLEGRDLRRGFTLTLLLLLGAAWLVSLAPLVFIARRISQPIEQLTQGLTAFAAGDMSRRVSVPRTAADDEVRQAVDAFNRMAEQLRQNRERLVHLTQMESWQSLARKTAHEVKNSLTPIRLTVEEMVARQPAGDRAFMDQAAQIVVSEIEALERRVRAFSDFSSEPPARAEVLDINALVAERVSLLRPAHQHTTFDLDLDARAPRACAGSDLVRGIITNLLQNAAEAAGADGSVLITTANARTEIVIEVHDSGAGLSTDAAATLFQPTITFKKHGMGLGLSIAKKNAILSGGDITTVSGRRGGAGFRVTLPAAPSP
jgi:two-component system nitrogen regulation sensor histidine kinase NtrY